MSHWPFEAWLLDDAVLTPEQSSQLELHVKGCRRCAALAESGAALRGVRLLPPRQGFVSRFGEHLAAHHAAERRRRVWGSAFLAASGLSLAGWWIAPYLRSFAASPGEWIAVWIRYLVYLASSLRTAFGLGKVLLRVALGTVAPYTWMILTSALAGLSLLWSVSLWRLSRIARGVRT